MAARKFVLPPVLYRVGARSIYRKSRRDEGAYGLWLVLAPDPESVRAQWPTIVPAGDWTIESITPAPANYARVF